MQDSAPATTPPPPLLSMEDLLSLMRRSIRQYEDGRRHGERPDRLVVHPELEYVWFGLSETHRGPVFLRPDGTLTCFGIPVAHDKALGQFGFRLEP